MCIIQGRKTHVENTNIFVAPLPEGKQLTVYSNKVTLEEDKSNNNAMILPSDENVRFIDLTSCKHIFKYLKISFKEQLKKGKKGSARSATNDTLEVIEVGSYRVSVVNSLDDFKYVSEEVFTLDPDVASYLKNFYSNGYSFLVCNLKPNAKYHPFAYVHNTLSGGNLFIPTRHFHLDEKGNQHTDWDHCIYTMSSVINKSFKVSHTAYSVPYSWDKFCQLTGLNVDDISKVSQYTIRNYHKNHDIVAEV